MAYVEIVGENRMATPSMNFRTPYSVWDKIRRLAWTVVWGVAARPLPKSVGRLWKVMLLRAFGAKVAWTANVYSSATIFKPWLLTMDDYSCMASGVDCYNAAPVRLGRHATVSQRAYLCTAGHDITDPDHRQTEAPIEIGERAWVCAEAFVGQGVKIGKGAVIAARAVCVKDVEPWTVVGGNPARIIKMRKLRNLTGGGLRLSFQQDKKESHRLFTITSGATPQKRRA